ncbi:protein SPT2 homolog [Dendronephthya gigantea]|uniref:protein SPT2 homolog n=1 Tax=Dendronephthya gigantea TaxID=151771 RepID=UPI00106AD121|nr:protein SPT2 homolog [Dendronephthya gigantea]XP_028407222.1 protein SPT2 homolog [Dendronephthya gigantea]
MQNSMDFSDLMNRASKNQENVVNNVKNKKSKDNGSNQVSSAAVKAFLARQNAEKIKQKEQEEAARRARIQARLQGKQLDKSKTKTNTEDVNKAGERTQQTSAINKHTRRGYDSTSSISKKQSKHNLAQKKKSEDERQLSKSKENEKLKNSSQERTNTTIEKKHIGKVKKPPPPNLSFQELMNVAKKQADNPEAFRAVNEQTSGNDSRERTQTNDQSMNDWRNEEIRIPGKNYKGTGNNDRKKDTVSQDKQSSKKTEKKLPESKHTKGKNSERQDQISSEIRHRKAPSTVDRKVSKGNNPKLSKNSNVDLRGKTFQKPKVMTIERETISQKDYGTPMKYQGHKEYFQRKRRHNPYEEEEEEDDDFIDDSEEAPDTISSYIKEIFGYDKNKFRGRDEDTSNMESSFGDIQREEAKSLRIAKLEDEVEKLKESYELNNNNNNRKKGKS